ncbi:MAG: AmmeMemoRadiSam system protein B [Bacteroidota bacterium]
MSLATRAVYPTQPGPLRQILDDLLASAPDAPEADVIALVVPDSNRLLGGAASAEAYAYIRGMNLETVVLVSPSHTGGFGRLSICQTDVYHTPLGGVPVNDRLRHELCDEDDDIFLDDTGHYHTEGADVQIPFLQRLHGDGFSVVPIVMGQESPAFCRELGDAVGEILYGQRALLIGTADFLSAAEGAVDSLREAIESFNVSELLHLLGSEKVKVEGMGALIVTLLAAQKRGATVAHVLSLDPPAEAGTPGPVAIAFTRS